MIGAPAGGCEKNGAVTSTCAPPPSVPAVVAATAWMIKLKRLPAASGSDGVMLTWFRFTVAIAIVAISLPSPSRNSVRRLDGSIA